MNANRSATLFLYLAIAIIVTSCSLAPFEWGKEKHHTISLTRSETEYAECNNAFTAELMEMPYQEKDAPYNYVISPISLQMFLGMLNACATDEQSAKICGMLGYEQRNVDKINNFCKKVIEESPTLDSKTTVSTTNFWALNKLKGFKFNDSFNKMMTDYYHAKVESMNFDDTANEFFHQWVSKETNGMIDFRTFFPSDMNCVPASTAYFKSEWKNTFDANNTAKGFFYEERQRYDSSPHALSTVEYMHGTFEKMEYYSNNLFSAVFLPFGKGTYEMVICLPNETNTSVQHVEAAIQWLKGNALPTKRDNERVYIQLPKFDMQSNVFLRDMIEKHFGIDLANQTNARYPLCGNDRSGTGLSFEDINHVARIRVDEEGAEAAAVTTVYQSTGIGGGTVEKKVIDFRATHPFIFMIRERGSGIIFFSGVYAGKQ